MRIHLVGVDGDLLSLENNRLLADHLSFLGCVTHVDGQWSLISERFFLGNSLLLHCVDGLRRAHGVVVVDHEPRVSTYFIVYFTRLVDLRLLVEGD